MTDASSNPHQHSADDIQHEDLDETRPSIISRMSNTNCIYSIRHHALLSVSLHDVPATRPAERGAENHDVLEETMGHLLNDRTIFLGSELNDLTADAIVSQLLLLDAQDPDKDIRLFINSPGGSVTAGMAVYDAMLKCRCDVSTVCFGLAASTSALILAGGTEGKRYSMPNARIMIHQPLGGATGQAKDIEIQARELMYHKANLNRILASHCHHTVAQVDEDTDRDRYMSPLEAQQYGVIDDIIGGPMATMVVEGVDLPAIYKTKKTYVAWGDDDDLHTATDDQDDSLWRSR